MINIFNSKGWRILFFPINLELSWIYSVSMLDEDYCSLDKWREREDKDSLYLVNLVDVKKNLELAFGCQEQSFYWTRSKLVENCLTNWNNGFLLWLNEEIRYLENFQTVENFLSIL